NIKQTPAVDPWGGSTTTSNTNISSPFGTTNEWPQSLSTISNGNSSSG
ncbi:unnamed protein product, partial [Rotaria sp. Silwood2]